MTEIRPEAEAAAAWWASRLGNATHDLARASESRCYLEPYHLQFRKSGTVTWRVMLGVSPGDALAKAVDWLRREGAAP